MGGISHIHRSPHQNEEKDLCPYPEFGELPGKAPGCLIVPLLEGGSHGHHSQESGEGQGSREGLFQGEEEEGQREEDQGLSRIPDMEAPEEEGEEEPRPNPPEKAQEDGGGNGQKGPGIQGSRPGKACEGREEDDDEDIIHRCPCHDHLGDAFLPAIALFHGFQHPGHDDSRGNRCDDGAQDGRIQEADPQQGRSQKDHPQNLQGGREEAHEDGRAAHFLQVLQVQVQPRPGEDDDQGDLPELGREGQELRIQKGKAIGSQEDACKEHPKKLGQAQLFQDLPQGHAQEEDQSKRQKHEVLLSLIWPGGPGRPRRPPVPPADGGSGSPGRGRPLPGGGLPPA